MLEVRNQIIQTLWQNYVGDYTHISKIIQSLPHDEIIKDHLAIIDLPGPHTGIKVLNKIFSCLDFVTRGSGYLPEKQNEFMWLAPIEAGSQKAKDVLLQIVVADFHEEDFSPKVREIILKYSQQASPFPWKNFYYLCSEIYNHNFSANEPLTQLVLDYINTRNWPLPSVKEYLAVKELNELLAWVLVFGRKPNHFGIQIHPFKNFNTLSEFNNFIQQQLNISLNIQAGIIKGDEKKNIAQSSTEGEKIKLSLSDGEIEIYSPFMEFVWRASNASSPLYWKDYYQGFIGEQATHVIESLYTLPMAQN
jgi:hypothetical protein